MEKQIYIHIADLLCLVCANVLGTTNKFSYNRKKLVRENLFVRYIENVILYYVMKVITWQRKMDAGGYFGSKKTINNKIGKTGGKYEISESK